MVALFTCVRPIPLDKQQCRNNRACCCSYWHVVFVMISLAAGTFILSLYMSRSQISRMLLSAVSQPLSLGQWKHRRPFSICLMIMGFVLRGCYVEVKQNSRGFFFFQGEWLMVILMSEFICNFCFSTFIIYLGLTRNSWNGNLTVHLRFGSVIIKYLMFCSVSLTIGLVTSQK